MVLEQETAQVLANYGVLGLWTIWLLIQETHYRKEMKKIIENNTQALTEFKFLSENCKHQ